MRPPRGQGPRPPPRAPRQRGIRRSTRVTFLSTGRVGAGVTVLECPNCHQKGEVDAPAEVVRAKFYKLPWPGYYTCQECSRRFSVKSQIRVS